MIFSYLENGERREQKLNKLTFDKKCDLLCIGIGAAGAYAAIAAAREGADVIALEKDETIGGMPINGKVPTFYYGDEGGTYLEIESNAAEMDSVFIGGYKHIESRHSALTKLFCSYVTKLFCTSAVIGVFMDGNTVIGVKALIDSKITNISCRLLIDSTSDGHIIRMCPVKTFLGRITDGKTAPFTNRIDYIDSKGSYGYYNDDDGYCNQYNPYEFSKKILRAHAAKLSFIDKKKGRLLSVAQAAGVREGIRFEGEETLSYKSMIMGEKPEKILFYARSDLDKHGRDLAIDDELYQNWWVICNLSTVTMRIPVPFGAVVPRGLRGIVSAGRCLSVDSYASSAVRMNRDMFRMGECVGIAAAMAIKSNCDFMDLDQNEYLKKVRKYNVFDGNMKDEYAFDAPNGSLYRPVRFDLTEAEIINGLQSDSPGEAIWACYISDGSIAEKLLKKESIDLHSAIALGIMGRKESLPTLRLAVINRNLDFFRGCRRSNQYKSAAAICLVGRLGDESDIELLSPIVFDARERMKHIYSAHNDPLVYASDRCAYGYYQIFTHAVIALLKLCRKFGKTDELRAKLDNLFSGESRSAILEFISNGDPESAAFDEAGDFMDNVLKML